MGNYLMIFFLVIVIVIHISLSYWEILERLEEIAQSFKELSNFEYTVFFFLFFFSILFYSFFYSPFPSFFYSSFFSSHCFESHIWDAIAIGQITIAAHLLPFSGGAEGEGGLRDHYEAASSQC